MGSRENVNPKKSLRPPFFGSFFGRAKNEQKIKIKNATEVQDNAPIKVMRNQILKYKPGHRKRLLFPFLSNL